MTHKEMLGVKDITASVLRIRKALIDNCYIINFNSDIKEIAIRIKQKVQVKLPDAIVAASAMYIGLPLLTADRNFRKIQGLNLMLMKL